MQKDSLKDYFYYKAKKEKYPARSVYKLEEIDKKYHIIKNGHKVLDLGASPGSWTKYCSAKVGEKGLVVGIDKEKPKLDLPGNTVFIQEDIFKLDIEKVKELSPQFDVVLSDLAPSTTGTREVDQARSIELVRQAFNIARQVLKENGNFVCKVFQGPDVKNFIDDIRPRFDWIKTAKPMGSRKESFEVYIVGFRFNRH